MVSLPPQVLALPFSMAAPPSNVMLELNPQSYGTPAVALSVLQVVMILPGAASRTKHALSVVIRQLEQEPVVWIPELPWAARLQMAIQSHSSGRAAETKCMLNQA